MSRRPAWATPGNSFEFTVRYQVVPDVHRGSLSFTSLTARR